MIYNKLSDLYDLVYQANTSLRQIGELLEDIVKTVEKTEIELTKGNKTMLSLSDLITIINHPKFQQLYTTIESTLQHIKPVYECVIAKDMQCVIPPDFTPILLNHLITIHQLLTP